MTSINPPPDGIRLESAVDNYDKTNSFLLLLVICTSTILSVMLVYGIFRIIRINFGPGRYFSQDLFKLKKIKKVI